MITTYGVAYGKHSGIVQKEVKMEDSTLLSPFDNFCFKFVKNTWKITEK